MSSGKMRHARGMAKISEMRSIIQKARNDCMDLQATYKGDANFNQFKAATGIGASIDTALDKLYNVLNEFEGDFEGLCSRTEDALIRLDRKESEEITLSEARGGI